jgi:hypothetical protein
MTKEQFADVEKHLLDKLQISFSTNVYDVILSLIALHKNENLLCEENLGRENLKKLVLGIISEELDGAKANPEIYDTDTKHKP